MTLIQRRHDLGWTQEHLAQTSGISVRTIQRLENGATAGGDSLQSLAAALDCDVACLLEYDPSDAELEFIKQRLGFRVHCLTVAFVMPCLILLNWLVTPGAGWILFALGGWAVGFALHAALVFLIYRPASQQA